MTGRRPACDASRSGEQPTNPRRQPKRRAADQPATPAEAAGSRPTCNASHATPAEVAGSTCAERPAVRGAAPGWQTAGWQPTTVAGWVTTGRTYARPVKPARSSPPG